MLYSSLIFANTSLQVVWVNFLVYAVNAISSIIALFLLNWYGRKILMLVFVPAQALMLILLSLFLGWMRDDVSDLWAIVCCLAFVTFFELSSGPIAILYIAEVCNDTAQAFANVGNMILWTGVSVGTPLVTQRSEYGASDLFLCFAMFNIFSTFVMAFYMKETKGKTPAEIQAMFTIKRNEN